MSQRQTAAAAAAVCVKQRSMLLFHPLSAPVPETSLYNRERSIVVSIWAKGQDRITSFEYKCVFCLKLILSIAIKNSNNFSLVKLTLTACLI